MLYKLWWTSARALGTAGREAFVGETALADPPDGPREPAWRGGPCIIVGRVAAKARGRPAGRP
jgi:hypothetical protein